MLLTKTVGKQKNLKTHISQMKIFINDFTSAANYATYQESKKNQKIKKDIYNELRRKIMIQKEAIQDLWNRF